MKYNYSLYEKINMKFGNVSHTIIQLPQFFNSQVRRLNTFKVPKNHQYFRYSDLGKIDDDLNYNNNFRKILFWTKQERIHNNKPEITMKSTLTTSTTNSQIIKKKPSNTLRKTMNVILQKIKSRTIDDNDFNSNKTFFDKQYQTCDREELFQQTLKDKVMSLRTASQKVKEQYRKRNLASQTKKCFEKEYKPTPNFRMTVTNIHNNKQFNKSLSMNNMLGTFMVNNQMNFQKRNKNDIGLGCFRYINESI